MGEFPSGQREQTVNLSSVTSVVRIHPHPPFRVFITDLSDEHSIFLCFFIVFNLCIEQVLACSFLLCREILNGNALSCFKDDILLFNRIINYPDKAIMNYYPLRFVLALAFPSVLFVKGEIKEIPYKITSKNNPDIVKGMLKVKNYEF